MIISSLINFNSNNINTYIRKRRSNEIKCKLRLPSLQITTEGNGRIAAY